MWPHLSHVPRLTQWTMAWVLWACTTNQALGIQVYPGWPLIRVCLEQQWFTLLSQHNYQQYHVSLSKVSGLNNYVVSLSNKRVKVYLHKNISSLCLKQDWSIWEKWHYFNKNGDSYHSLNFLYTKSFTYIIYSYPTFKWENCILENSRSHS